MLRLALTPPEMLLHHILHTMRQLLRMQVDFRTARTLSGVYASLKGSGRL
jgi:hypothetical protein